MNAQRFTPDTLDEERLRKAVDEQTYSLGEGLFEDGCVKVEELYERAAICSVMDKRKYKVEIKLSKSHLLFKCNCLHANRGLVCEHGVAGWLGLQKHLRHHVYPVWRSQLNRVIDALPDNSPSHYSDRLLFFSIQDASATGYLWKIFPYTIPLKALPNEIMSFSGPDNHLTLNFEALNAHLRTSNTLNTQLRKVYFPLEINDCFNCTPQAVVLANLIADDERSNKDFFTPSLDRWLTLTSAALENVEYPTLFLGNSVNPLQERIKISSELGTLCLSLANNGEGMTIRARLALGEQKLQFIPEDVRVINTNPLWILMDGVLTKLSNPIGSDLLAAFLETPEVFIPADQVAEFLEKYYLQLARQIPMEGDIVNWEVTNVEPIPRLYLSEQKNELLAQLRFAYGETEVNYDPDFPSESIVHEPGSWTLVRITRQPELEKSFHKMLVTPAFGLKRTPTSSKAGIFRLRARTQPVDFLLRIVPRLAKKGFELYGEEQLKTARVNRNTPTISFNIASGIDWFDLHAVVNYGELGVSLKDIHRAIRKKEHFIKLADGSIGQIPDEWFERYKHLFGLSETKGENLRISRLHVSILDELMEDADQVQMDKETEQQRLRFHRLNKDGFSGITARDIPPTFVGELRPYQKSGFNWLHFLHDYSFGGCLADDMGLGKTIQALVFLQSLYSDEEENHKPESASLLVVPRSLLVNWQREASRFTPKLRILEYFDQNRRKDRSFDNADLIITTYGVMLRDIEFLHGYTFHYAILDESQAVKNPLSQTAKAARLLRAHHRLVLTGTPIENSTAELWSQFAFLNPGLLGSLEYFRLQFGTPIERRGDEEAAALLRKIVYPFILRRTKDQVATELPPRSERLVYSDMEPAQHKLYNRTRDQYRGLVLGMIEKQGMNESRMHILEGLLRLRQIANHPRLMDEDFRGNSGKFELLFDTLETLQSEGHKALVFSQFVKMLHLVRGELDRRKTKYTYLDGSTHSRQEQVDVFQNNPEIPFFLISLKAGGLGLNLTAADYVIHIDPWWNPAVEMQASDRTHRIGQDKPVFVFKLITRDSVEEKILLLQERKRQLVNQIITTEGSFFKNLSLEDVQTLFS